MAFEIRERSDHDGIELVAQPRLHRRVVLVGGGVALVIAGFATALHPALGVFVASTAVVLAPAAWAASGERTTLVLTTRELRVGELEVRLEDLESATEGHGAVRITVAGRTFEVGHDWPAASRKELVGRIRAATAQRKRQLDGAEPEQPPPAAIQALRGQQDRS